MTLAREMSTGVLAFGSEDGRVRLVDGPALGQERWNIQGHSKAILCVAFSPDGAQLATGSEDRSWRIWDAASGGERLCVRGHDLDTDNDEPFHENCQCEMDWGGCAIVISQCPLQGHGGAVTSIAWSPCGQRVATGSRDQTVVLWDSRTGEAELRPGRTGDLSGERWDHFFVMIMGAEGLEHNQKMEMRLKESPAVPHLLTNHRLFWCEPAQD